MIQRFDRSLGDLSSFSETQEGSWLWTSVSQGIVDLKNEAGIDDRSNILHEERRRRRLKTVLLMR